MDLSVKLEVFDGPLDLLLHLIEKNKVSIYDIPIVEITKQYMDYLLLMKDNQLAVASEFLVMAATLLEIKSRMLIPVTEEEAEEQEDPRDELVRRLLEKKMYLEAAGDLREQYDEAQGRMYRKEDIPAEVLKYREPVDAAKVIENAGITPERLKNALDQAIRRQREKIDPIRSKFGTIKKSRAKIGEKLKKITNFAKEHKKFNFRTLLEEKKDKESIIVTFLAILELMKVGQITATQEESFGEIDMVWNTENLYRFNEKDLDQYE
ncbi:MAG: segregation/condensation protein A [Lachnospiraceae bacterium]|nr:segregation/condensation protein A [Lachnospiraceae bacterium]